MEGTVTTSTTEAISSRATASEATRWGQLIFGIICMVLIANMIASSGYEAAFWWFGIGQGVVVILVALLLRAPEAGEVVAPAAPSVQQTRRDYSPAEVLAPLVTSQFYKSPFLIMYLMFV